MQEQAANALKKGATIVTANRRLARSLQQEYNALQPAGGLKAWESPKVLTWSGWMNDLWKEFLYVSENPQVLLNPWQERILWEQAIRNAPESGELLQVHATASAAQEAWSLANEWRLDWRQVENLGHEDVRAFLAWAKRFQKICAGQGWIEYARSVDVLRKAVNRLPLPSNILLTGFDEFTQQQQDFLDAASKAGCRIARLSHAEARPGAGAVRVPFPDAEREIEAAARWARALLETGATGKIGVVVAGLVSCRNLVERIFRCYLEPAAQLPGERPSSKLINLSAGNTLAYYPIIQSALAILSLSPENNDWRSIGGLLLSPFIRGADMERIPRALLDARMRRDCGSDIHISYLNRLCREQEPHCPWLGRALGSWLKIRSFLPRTQTAGQWSQTFASMVEAFGWPGERGLNSAEFQTLQAWNALLSGFASTDLTSGSISMGEAVSLVKRIAGQTMFQPETEQAAVQILGALEASGLFFDHLWIAGLHDEVWPGPAHPNPFLPARLQREKGIPRCCPERELEFTAMITRRLLASGSNVIISYPLRAEDRELAPSPLIASVASAAPEDLNLWNGDSIQEIIRQSRSVEILVDEKGPPLVESSRQRGGTKVFQYQAGCPFRAFAELRLGAEKLEFPVPGLDPRQRGILVHSALEEIWKQLRTHAALCLEKDLPEAIRGSIETALARFEQERGSALPPRFADLERARLQRLLTDWLEFEKKREPFEVVQPEGERFAEVSGIRFKVKIDRIDRLSDGREAIIDYKTGEPNARSWETDRPDEPQLPLYSTIHEKPLAGVLFAQIKPGKLRFLGFVDNNVSMPGGVPTDLSARIKEWRAMLEKLGSDFRTGHAEVDPKNPGKTCRYCPQPFFCRISESKIRRKEEEAG